MASTQIARKLAAILVGVVINGVASADEAALREEQARAEARSSEAKRQAEERMRESRPEIHRGPYQPPAVNHSQMFVEATRLEREGNTREAVKAHVRAARAGSGKAARRLAEIYDTGIAGVPRDPNESVKWNNFARMMGEDIPKPRIQQ